MSAGFVARFRAVAREHADAVAVCDASGAALSYSALDLAARRHAARLLAGGVRHGDLVAHVVPRSADTVVAILGAWMAGAAFLPLDEGWPRARIRAVTEEAGCRALVASRAAEGTFRDELRPTLRVDAGEDRTPPLSEDDVARAGGDDLAYVICTSGSTGRPKGVRVAHRGLVPVLAAQIDAFGLGPGQRSLWLLSPCFDASLSDVGTALLSGATLVLPPGDVFHSPRRLLETLRDGGITYVDLPPSLLSAIDPSELPACLRTVVIGGEPAPPEHVRAWATRVRLINVYGPTEATICTSFGVCDDAWSKPLLGRPFPFVRYRVERRPGDADDEGELLIGGETLALGYIARPELEAERFVTVDGARWYRTSDRVRVQPDGELAYLGRFNRQLKVRGRLVAPEEIEAALARCPGVREAAVGLAGDALVAFVAATDGAPLDLRAWLAGELPPWMVPARIEVVDALPRTSAGKIDHAALAARFLREPRQPESSTTSPGALLERLVAGSLGVAAVGLDDDFFALGGDSYAALLLVAAAEAAGVSLPPGAPYTARTLRAMRDRAGQPTSLDVSALREQARATAAGLVEVARGVRRGDAILVTGAAGFLGARVVAELLRRDDRPVVALVRGRDREEARRKLARALGELGVGAERVRVVHGDAAAPGCGLDPETWASLLASVGDIAHLAARVSVVEPLEALFRDNVLATREVLRLALAAGATMHHASTLAVFLHGSRVSERLREDASIDAVERVDGGYAQSKWIAEALVREAERLARRPLASVIRLGLLTGDADTGEASRHCQLTAFLRGTVALGCVPAGSAQALRLDVTPVDHAARAIAAIVRSADAAGNTFHVANEASASLADLLRALADAGHAIDVVDAMEFRRRVGERGPAETDVAGALLSAAHALLGGEGHRSSDLFLATGHAFDRARADALLLPYGEACPPPDATLLATYVKRAVAARARAEADP